MTSQVNESAINKKFHHVMSVDCQTMPYNLASRRERLQKCKELTQATLYSYYHKLLITLLCLSHPPLLSKPSLLYSPPRISPSPDLSLIVFFQQEQNKHPAGPYLVLTNLQAVTLSLSYSQVLLMISLKLITKAYIEMTIQIVVSMVVPGNQ